MADALECTWWCVEGKGLADVERKFLGRKARNEIALDPTPSSKLVKCNIERPHERKSAGYKHS